MNCIDKAHSIDVRYVQLQQKFPQTGTRLQPNQNGHSIA